MLTMSTQTRSDIVVISGASTGIGAATAAELAKRGFHVLAGVRRTADGEKIRASGVEPVLLDITDKAAVAAIADRVTKDGRPLRALINNAGIAVLSPVEALPLDDWRHQFEVNLFGHVALTQALLPALLKSRGTVVNISSIGGKVALPTYGAYAASKFALEAVSDSLRREVAELGVKVVVIQPGSVITEIIERAAGTVDRLVQGMTAEQTARYSGLMQAVVAQGRASGSKGVRAEDAAKIIADATLHERPRTRYLIGRDAAIISRLVGWLSDRAIDGLLARDLRQYFPKPVR